MKRTFKCLILTAILFLAINFLSLLPYLHSPLTKEYAYGGLKIGFPYIIYSDFLIDCNNINHSWNLNNIIFNFIATLLMVFITDLILKKVKKRIL